MVQRKCQPFLKEWLPIFKQGGGVVDELFMWRGSETISGQYGVKPVRQERLPMTTKEHIHQEIDRQMFKRFKIHGRSKTIFCTGSKSLAEGYGKAYMVFPVGNYKYIWSPKVDDMFVAISRTTSGYRYNVERDVDIELHKLGYDTDLDFEKREMRKKKIRERFLKGNEKALDKLLKTFKTTGLNVALKGRNEVAFECKSYIYFSFKLEAQIAELAWDMVE